MVFIVAFWLLSAPAGFYVGQKFARTILGHIEASDKPPEYVIAALCAALPPAAAIAAIILFLDEQKN